MTRRWPVRPADRPAGRQVSAKLTDEGPFVSCPARRRRPPYPGGISRHQPKPPSGRLWRDLIIAKNDQRTSPYPHCCQRQRRRGYFAPRRELLLSAVTKVAKSTGRNCVSALPQRAMPVRCRPRFPSRNRRFPDRCRSADCASTAFRCRCLLLRQKLFVLPCRRLRNNYILCPTGTPTFAALRRQRRDLIIATRSAHQPLSSHCISGSGARGTSDPPNRQRPPPHQFREASTAKFALTRPAPRDP